VTIVTSNIVVVSKKISSFETMKSYVPQVIRTTSSVIRTCHTSTESNKLIHGKLICSIQVLIFLSHGKIDCIINRIRISDYYYVLTFSEAANFPFPTTCATHTMHSQAALENGCRCIDDGALKDGTLIILSNSVPVYERCVCVCVVEGKV
jgi:hypothetical protein